MDQHTQFTIPALRRHGEIADEHIAPQFDGFTGLPTTTNGAQNFRSAHSGCRALSIMANMDFCNASPCESFGSAAMAA
jgi:hypothetical protein